MFQNILCWFGFHNWSYGRNDWTRKCNNCGYYQVADWNMFGMKYWRDR